MVQKRDIIISAIVVTIAVIFIQLVMGESFLGIQRRWFIFGGLGLALLFVFFSIRNKELFLLKVTLFFLPYQLGFLYTGAVDQDLIFAFDVGLFALYFYWMIETRGFQNAKFYWPKAILPASLFIAWSFTALPFTITPLSASIGIWFNLKGFLFFFYIINRVTDKKKLRVIIHYLIIVLAVEGVISLLQKVVPSSVGLQFLGMSTTTFLMDMSRVGGTFLLPNLFGAFMSCLMPIAIGYLLFIKKQPNRLLVGVIAILGFLGLFWSLSRSSWVGIIGGVIIMGFLMMRSRSKHPGSYRTLFVVLIVILVIIVVFYDIIMRRWETGATMEGRIEIMKIALRIIAINPVTGVGLHNYEYHSYPLYAFWRPVHNEYLRLAAEVGIPGAIFFFWFLYLCCRNAMRGLKLADRFLNMVALAVLGSFTSFFILIFFGPEYQHYRLKILIWILAGLGTVILRIRRLEIARSRPLQTESVAETGDLSP